MDENQPLIPGIVKISHDTILAVKRGPDGEALATHASTVLPEGYAEVDADELRAAEAEIAAQTVDLPAGPDPRDVIADLMRRVEQLEHELFRGSS